MPRGLTPKPGSPRPATTSWGNTAAWVEGTVPNAVGATAIFNNPTAARTVTLGGSTAPCPGGTGIGCNFTVGSISMDNNSAFTTTIRNDATVNPTAATLTFDAAGAGPATITVTGTATNQNLITATMVFNDTVDVTVPTGGNAAARRAQPHGRHHRSGGLTKSGPGTLTMAFISGSSGQVKAYTGPTVVHAGRLRLSQGGAPRRHL